MRTVETEPSLAREDEAEEIRNLKNEIEKRIGLPEQTCPRKEFAP